MDRMQFPVTQSLTFLKNTQTLSLSHSLPFSPSLIIKNDELKDLLFCHSAVLLWHSDFILIPGCVKWTEALLREQLSGFTPH